MAHTPVLLQFALNALQVVPDGKYIDATAGEGGHIQEILNKGAEVLAIDADPQQIQNLELKIQNPRLTLVNSNYSNIEAVAKDHDFYPVDGILFDLGLSMAQINSSGRGFSFKKPEEPIDMRLDLNQELTAQKILNEYDQEQLYNLFAKYSEDTHSRDLAQQVAHWRTNYILVTVGDFLTIIDKVLDNCQQHHDHQRTDMYAKVFQALRIEVNKEIEHIKQAIKGAINILKKEGTLVIITFHSVEDRVVKLLAKELGLKMIKQTIVYHKLQSFERSAKLRVMKKI